MNARELDTISQEIWQEDVGYSPYKVTILEMATRKRVLYLRWRATKAAGKARNWEYESLGRTLHDAEGKRLTGRALNDVKRWAREKAKAKHHELVTGVSPADVEPTRPLSIRETWAKVSDAKTGLFPVDTHHRREVKRALDDAVRVWGGDTLWLEIRKPQLLALGRARVDELLTAKLAGAENVGEGYRGAEVTLTRVLTVAQWLRDSELIPADAAVPKKTWKEELRTYWSQARGVKHAPEPHRPRVTIEQLREVIRVAPLVDPRFGLIVHVGIGMRPGQVARVARSKLDFAKGEHGALRVESSGRKKGVLRHLTKGQRAALDRALGADGYLRHLEARYQLDGTDYLLFPAGQMPGGRKGDGVATLERHGIGAGSVGRTALREWFKEARELAKVPEVRGLGLYGLKRAIVDGVKEQKISREGLQETGGWTSTQMADEVYADEEKEYARKEASDVIAGVLGEDGS
jgi:hypothetical protein